MQTGTTAPLFFSLPTGPIIPLLSGTEDEKIADVLHSELIEKLLLSSTPFCST